MSTISAGTTSTTAFKVTGDTTGTLQLQTGATPTTAIDISASQVVSFPATTTLSFSGSLTLPGQTANGVAYLNGSKVLTSGSALTFDGTNLGVGGSAAYPIDVTSTNARVRVAPSTTTNYALFQATNAGNTAYIGLDNSAGGLTAAYALNLYHNGAYPITFSTTGTERARLDANGNLGIGTSSPASKLDVTGSFSTGTTAFTIYNNSGASASNIARIDFRVNNTFGGNERVAAIWGLNPNAGANNGGALVFGVSANGTSTTPSEVARFDQAGNLGLGVTPSAWSGAKAIDVGQVGTGVSGSAGNANITQGAYNDGSWKRSQASYGVNLFNVSNGAYYWFQAASGSTGSAISWTQAMTLNGSGYLGINSTSPSTFLHVNGAYASPQALITQTSAGGNNGIFFHAQGNASHINWCIGQQRTLSGFEITPSTVAGGTTFSNPAFVIDSASGFVGIGTIGPIGRLTTAGSGDQSVWFTHTDNIPGRTVTLRLGNNDGTYRTYSPYIQAIEGSGFDNYSLAFATSSTTSGGAVERGRITSGGDFWFGINAGAGTGIQQGFSVAPTSGFTVASHAGGTASGTSYIYFNYNAGTIGSITQNGTTGVLYNITSDYRLKEFVAPVTNAGERIDALNPVEFDWKSDGSRARGFFAHEFQQVYANSVTGEKDGVDADGNPVYQTMQASTAEVIADLVAEIQSLRARLAALEAK